VKTPTPILLARHPRSVPWWETAERTATCPHLDPAARAERLTVLDASLADLDRLAETTARTGDPWAAAIETFGGRP
jgi:hypothetical protein